MDSGVEYVLHTRFSKKKADKTFETQPNKFSYLKNVHLDLSRWHLERTLPSCPPNNSLCIKRKDHVNRMENQAQVTVSNTIMGAVPQELWVPFYKMLYTSRGFLPVVISHYDSLLICQVT